MVSEIRDRLFLCVARDKGSAFFVFLETLVRLFYSRRTLRSESCFILVAMLCVCGCNIKNIRSVRALLILGYYLAT